jgi:plasmid maintenance system antidote protein VapI
LINYSIENLIKNLSIYTLDNLIFFMIDELINKAAEKCGNFSKLAKRMNVSPQRVHNWKAGKMTCTPETAIELADIAGENGAVWALRAIIEKHRGTNNEAHILRGILSGVEVGIIGGNGGIRTLDGAQHPILP